MFSTIIKSGLQASSKQIQAKRFLYPRSKYIVVRRKTADELGATEKIFYGALFVTFMYSVPFYVMSNLENYRNGNN